MKSMSITNAGLSASPGSKIPLGGKAVAQGAGALKADTVQFFEFFLMDITFTIIFYPNAPLLEQDPAEEIPA